MEQQQPVQHDRIIERLLEIASKSPALTAFHRSAILGTISRLHPTAPTLYVVKQVTEIGFRRRSDWLVRQAALRLLFVLPAREGTALKRAQNSLQHHHPFVRRAAMLMLLRAGVQDVRDALEWRLDDPDPAVARLALHWHRHLRGDVVAKGVLGRMRKAKATDESFLWNLPRAYLLRCHESPEIVRSLRDVLLRHGRSRSAKVQHHMKVLLRLTDWAK
jgi:hypothetical protein